MTLSALTTAIERVVSGAFTGRYWVLADVSSYKAYPNKGHHYFELVEKGKDGATICAKVSAVAWREGNERIRRFEQGTGQRFGDGIHVLCCVQVDYHRLYGLRLELFDISLEYTLGRLKQQRDTVLLKLQQECSEYVRLEDGHYVTSNSLLELPLAIQRIAIVGAPGSAGLEDFEHSLNHNGAGYAFQIDVYACRVQGEGGEIELCNRLSDIVHSSIMYDAVVIVRGGGSQTGFLMFDQYAVGWAIASYPLPIITGIGHLRDQTVADQMAHTSAMTPTKAAEFILSHNRGFEAGLNQMLGKVIIRSQSLVAEHIRELTRSNSVVAHRSIALVDGTKERLSHLKTALAERAVRLLNSRSKDLQEATYRVTGRPAARLAEERSRITAATARLKTSSRALVKSCRGSLSHQASMVQLASPESVLRRGYTLIEVGGRIVIDPLELPVGGNFSVRSARGLITATVQSNTNTL